jgi:small subunit ribosomal protein S17
VSEATAAGERARRKVRTGVVVSDAMDKTVVVRIDRQFRHALYGKAVRRSSKLAAHDEANDAHVGDTVRVMETRPLSKTKRWRVVEVVERAK